MKKFKLKSAPKLSVVMIAYNAEKYIDSSIESVLSQSISNFELIIVNDGSTDATANIIDKWRLADSRVVVINNEKNKGIVYSRNIGLSRSLGKYIAIQDADDISFKIRLQLQSDFLDRNKHIFLVATGAIIIDSNDSYVRSAQLNISDKDLKKRLEKKNAIFHSSIMFRNENRFYRNKFPLAEDYDFFLLALSEGKVISGISRCLIKYRVADSSASFSNQAKIRLFSEKALSFYLQRVKTGEDDYNNFEPAEILDIDISSSVNKTVLGSVIRNSFIFGDYRTVKVFCKKFFSNYGLLNKYALYFLASFLGKKINNFLIKFLPVRILRLMNE
jgi:glycosyltransferase involved in cell wall biosynthesis